jgi:hypothetical protein
MNDETLEHRVTLLGGPLDGWPILIHGNLPDELRLPYSRAMLDLASRSPARGSREEWSEIRFPSEADADGVAVYRPSRQTAARDPVYLFAGTDVGSGARG